MNKDSPRITDGEWQRLAESQGQKRRRRRKIIKLHHHMLIGKVSRKTSRNKTHFHSADTTGSPNGPGFDELVYTK